MTDFKLAAIHGMLYTGGNLLFSSNGSSVLSPVSNCLTSVGLKQSGTRSYTVCNSTVQCFDVSEDGDLAIVVGHRGLAMFYSFPADVVLDTISLPPQCAVQCVKFSGCGSYVALGLEGTLQIYSTPASRVVSFHGVHRIENIHHALQMPITSMDWLPLLHSTSSRTDTKRLPLSSHLLFAGQDTRIKIISTDSRDSKGLAAGINQLIGHRSAVILAQWMDDEGTGVLSVGSDNVVIRWQRTTVPRVDLLANIAKLRAEALVHRQFDPEEDIPETLLERQRREDLTIKGVRVKCVETDHLHPVIKHAFEIRNKFMLQHSGTISTASFHKARGLLAVGYTSGIFAIHAAVSEELSLLHYLSISAQSLTSSAFSPNGELIAFGSAMLKQLMVWDWKAESYVLKEQSHYYDINVSALSPDGSILISGGEEGKVKLWKMSDGQCFATFPDHTAGITGLTINPSTNAVFSCSKDGTIRGFDLVRYRCFRVMQAPNKATQFSCLALDPSGEIIAAGSALSNSILLFSSQTGRVIDELDGHEGPVTCLAMHPGGTTLFSGALDRNLCVWDLFADSTATVEGGSRLKGTSEFLPQTAEVVGICCNGNGHRTACLLSSGDVTIFDSTMPKELIVLVSFSTTPDAVGGWTKDGIGPNSANYSAKFTCIAFSPCGEKLVCAGESRWIGLYHARQGFLLKKWCVSSNYDVQGVEEQYPWQNMSEAGNVLLIDTEDDDPQWRKNIEMPGTKHRFFATGKRKTELTSRCTHLCFAAHGREFTAATSDGLLVFSLEVFREKFAPLQLRTNLTPALVLNLISKHEYSLALSAGLLLRRKPLVIEIVRKTPTESICAAVMGVPTSCFPMLVSCVASEVEKSRSIEHSLLWAQAILVYSNEPLLSSWKREQLPSDLHPSLRLLQRALLFHRDLVNTSRENLFSLRYLTLKCAKSSPSIQTATTKLTGK